jgi:hypothetical protein
MGGDLSVDENVAFVAEIHGVRAWRGSGIDALWPEARSLLASGTTVLALAALRLRKTLD